MGSSSEGEGWEISEAGQGSLHGFDDRNGLEGLDRRVIESGYGDRHWIAGLVLVEEHTEHRASFLAHSAPIKRGTIERFNATENKVSAYTTRRYSLLPG